MATVRRRPSHDIGSVTIQVSKKFQNRGHVYSPARMQANMLQEALQEHSAAQATRKSHPNHGGAQKNSQIPQ